MAHLHSVYDTDTHFKVNDVTRKITDVSNSKTVIMQYDHNSERLTFEMPRYVDGHDMKDCNVVQVHYINVSNNKVNRMEGIYEVEDFQISPEDENVVICSWLISQNATQYVGSLNFLLRFVCSNDGNVDYAWNTAIYTDIVVSDGMYNGDFIVEEYADVLEQWRRELSRTIELDTTLSIEGMAADAKAVGDALANINVSGGGGTAVDIVQTTGDSETAVMSQKAVTEALDEKLGFTEQSLTADQKNVARYNLDLACVPIRTDLYHPIAVVNCMEKGTPYTVTHTDATYGNIVFDNFVYAESFDTIVSSAIILYGGSYLNVELVGSVTAKEWTLFVVQMATADDIPAVPATLPNPNAITINGTSYDGSTEVNIDNTVFYINTTCQTAKDENGEFTQEEWTQDKTFAEIEAAYNAGRPIMLKHASAFTTIGYRYTLYLIQRDSESHWIFGGHISEKLYLYVHLKDVGWNSESLISLAKQSDIPTSLKNPYTLTINGTAYDGSEAVNLTIEGGGNVTDYVRYNAQTLTEEQKSQARENIGAEPLHVLTDEELIESGYVLQESDLIRGAIWVSSSTTFPTDFPGRACTRKFNVSFVPKVMWSDEVNCNNMQFWRNGAVAKEVNFTVLKETWEVDIDFDQVTFNVAYGGTFPTDVMDIKVEKPKSHLFKKVLVIGDSISADYYGNYTKWVTMLTDEGFFPADTTNDSIHATGFVARYNNEANDFVTRIASVTNKDSYELVVILGGINDYIQGIPMGESGGDKMDSFIPAVDYFFDYVVNNFPQARIVVLSPLRTYNVYKNTVGHHQTEYADYIKTVAKSYCLPVLNLTEESGFCPFVDAFKNMWTLIPSGYTSADGVHPNAEYQKKFLAPMIKGFLLNIKPK